MLFQAETTQIEVKEENIPNAMLFMKAQRGLA
jgi:hypothetical protein